MSDEKQDAIDAAGRYLQSRIPVEDRLAHHAGHPLEFAQDTSAYYEAEMSVDGSVSIDWDSVDWEYGNPFNQRLFCGECGVYDIPVPEELLR